MHFAISGQIEQPRDHNEGYFSRRKIFCQLGATKLQKSRKKHVQQGGKGVMIWQACPRLLKGGYSLASNFVILENDLWGIMKQYGKRNGSDLVILDFFTPKYYSG